MGNMLPRESADLYDVPTLYMLLGGTKNHQLTHSKMWSLSSKSFSSG